MSKCYCETVYDGYCGHCFDTVERERDEAIKERDEARAYLSTAAYMYASYLEESAGGLSPSDIAMIDRWRKAAGLEHVVDANKTIKEEQ